MNTLLRPPAARFALGLVAISSGLTSLFAVGTSSAQEDQRPRIEAKSVEQTDKPEITPAEAEKLENEKVQAEKLEADPAKR